MYKYVYVFAYVHWQAVHVLSLRKIAFWITELLKPLQKCSVVMNLHEVDYTRYIP